MKSIDTRPESIKSPNALGSESSTKNGAHFWNGRLKIENRFLKDEFDRTVLLRGVNLTGNSKLPTSPVGCNHPNSPQFFDHRNVSFVGRPFSVADAHEHFQRLNSWGLTFARLLVPWEALGK